MQPKDRIIVALDVPNLVEASNLVTSLIPYVGCFKVGLELLTSVGGRKVVEFIHERGGQVFYDGKFCDIPHTVAGASKAVAAMKVKMFNLHASCSAKSIEAAVTNRGESLVIGVTVLTSIDPRECIHIFGASPEAKVFQFSQMLLDAGGQGIVCSPQELQMLGKYRELDKLLRIIPGIRPEWAAVGDQKRVMTPAEAIKAGATALVIGRPITNPPKEIGSPVEAVKRILEEIESVS